MNLKRAVRPAMLMNFPFHVEIFGVVCPQYVGNLLSEVSKPSAVAQDTSREKKPAPLVNPLKCHPSQYHCNELEPHSFLEVGAKVGHLTKTTKNG
jgi:hypothetical protein